MKYHLYHDESKVDGYWHGMLLVPENKKHILFQYLQQIRKNTGYQEAIGIKKVKDKNRIFTCAESWVLFAIHSMMTKFTSVNSPIMLGIKYKNAAKPIYEIFEKLVQVPIGAKFVLFRERDNLTKMSNSLDYGGKVETTFRMGLKGGIHFLGNSDNPIEISEMHFDGWEHHQRSIDHNRIIGRLTNLKEYFIIANDKYSINDATSNHNNKGCQPYEDCQFLQLTDLLIGAFRIAYGHITTNNHLHKKIAEPAEYLIKKYREGYARMQNSRWKGALCTSQCFLEDGKWNFQSIEYNSVAPKQGDLFK